MTSISVPPTQLTLEILPEVQQEFWQQGQQFAQSPEQWVVYLNQLCLNTVLPWLQQEQSIAASVWPDQAALLSFWSVVTGTAISFGSKRLLLLPSLAIDHSEIRVPQEWVDIPDWAADYYLAIQVNPDEQWLQVWGYTTHEQLKTQAIYNPDDRSYSLEAQAMIQDLSVLWVVQQVLPEELTRGAIAPLPNLPTQQAQNLVQRLANPAIASPRLEIPFQLWAGLLVQPEWRKALYQQRYGALAMQSDSEAPIVNLRQWFEDAVDTVWQSLESLLEAQPELSLNFRRTDTADARLKRGRGIRLPNRGFGDEPIALIVSLELESEQRVRVRGQLYPLGSSKVLPEGIRLELVSDQGQVVQSVEARSQDNYIQLPRFTVPTGTFFRLRVTLGYFVFSSAFVS